MNDLDDNCLLFPKHNQNKAQDIEKTIREIKIQYKKTEQRIHDSGIPCVAVDVTALIKSQCQKHGVKEDTIRRIAGWEGLRTGNNRIDTKISKDETD